jgi:pimeloyl-ACP methyl ester carboxylesterase
MEIQMPSSTDKRVTAVLVHAAWADGSSWNKVAGELLRVGLGVMAAQLPLTSLNDDVAAVRRLLQRALAPVVLVGHSYGGAVITAAGAEDPKIKGLVYIAALAPDTGETVGQLFYRAATHPSAPHLEPDEHGLLWAPRDAFHDAIAPDASPEETAVMGAVQKPIAVKCLGEAMTAPGWRRNPSWFLVAENDRLLSPDTQRFMAARMGARVTSLPVDHTPLVSRPEAVARLIAEAAGAI